ncbi:hypothetical protein D3C71_1865240 [compost metagenome]
MLTAPGNSRSDQNDSGESLREGVNGCRWAWMKGMPSASPIALANWVTMPVPTSSAAPLHAGRASCAQVAAHWANLARVCWTRYQGLSALSTVSGLLVSRSLKSALIAANSSPASRTCGAKFSLVTMRTG